MNLSNLGIDTIPNDIGILTDMQFLDLSNNNLKTLPDSIVNTAIFDTVTRCQGPCGSENCCYIQYYNGLNIKHNNICSLTIAVSTWLDKQFGRTNYLAFDTTQTCTQ